MSQNQPPQGPPQGPYGPQGPPQGPYGPQGPPQGPYGPQQGRPQNGPYPGQSGVGFAPPPPLQKTKPGPLFLLLIGIVALLVIYALGGRGSDNAAAPATSTSAATSSAPASRATNAPKKKAAPTVADTIEEGTYEIGVDAQPGRYKTRVPEDSVNCYWERAKDDKGDFNSILANENLNPGARGTVSVKKGEFFKSRGCGTWEKQ